MPLVRLTAAAANRNLRHNRASFWPDGRLPGDRLSSSFAQVSLKPSFTFSREDKILTLGSCFAREMENRLDSLKFDLPMRSVVIPEAERSTKTLNDILNKYTVQSIENELVWAQGKVAPPPPEKLFLELASDSWHDPQLVHNITPGPIERLIDRRRMVQDAVKRMAECRIVVITLGLAEAWFDHETGLYLNTSPPGAAIHRQKDRFSFDVLSYEDILASLERIHAVLTEAGHPDFKILVTVSPVPFKATFTGEDAITANGYSKAVQRAACEAFAVRHDNVDYFPSYEIVTMSDREMAYERDNVHVGVSMVAQVVERVLTQYAPTVEFSPAPIGLPKTRRRAAQGTHFDQLVLAKHHAQSGDYRQAAEITGAAIQQFTDRVPARHLSALRSVHANYLIKLKRWPEAIEQLQIATETLQDDPSVYLRLGRGYVRMREFVKAVDALERAAELSPGDPDAERLLEDARRKLARDNRWPTVWRALRRLLPGRPAGDQPSSEPAARRGAAAG